MNRAGPSKRNSRLRHAVAALTTLLACALILTGCAPSPEFSTPIRWSANPYLANADDVQPLPEKFAAPKNFAVELRGGGVGSVTNFPRGTIREEADGMRCLDVSESGTYSGEITWKASSEHTVVIEFAESEVILATNPGKFGSQDWIELRIWPCDLGNAYWRVGLECGSPRPEFDAERWDIPPCNIPE